ncbi:MAG TPA: RHS repeat-associated core domain-containing protein, partial [Pyrinomonadaceae bacterium]|nr:RHS repeat-associated core domain-containing protein [Pyrinomonadaceae bacterium]
YGAFGTYSTGDKLRVSVEGSVVKYRKNGTLLRTSTLAPTYPLYAGASIYSNAGTAANALLSIGGDGVASELRWLVPDHLGTPRMIFDLSGSLANMKRHDYLPFGEELFPPTGGRSAAMGYSGDGVRQQFTQKERDTETGLDYFGARYYSSTQGRFTSPDPLFFQKEMMLDPQRFNLYSYVRNNPLKLVDPKGLAIELTGDEAERKRKLELIKQAVGKEAATYLYENKGKDGKYYVGIYTNGPDGKSKPFEQVNNVAGSFARVINDKFAAQIQIVPNGTEVELQGGKAVIGTVDRANGVSPGAAYVDQHGRATIYLLDPKTDPGKLPAAIMSDGNHHQLVLSDVLAHETAHVEARWGHVVGSSNTHAVDLENQARKLRDPTAPTRTGHDKPRDAWGPHRLIINVRPGTESNWKP